MNQKNISRRVRIATNKYVYGFVLLVVVLLLLNMKHRILIHDYEEISFRLNSRLSQMQTENQLQKRRTNLEYSEECKYLDDCLLVQLENGEKWPIKEYIEDYPMIIFRHEDLSCSSCVDSQLVVINEFASLFEKHGVIISSYSDIGKLNAFKRINGYQFEILNSEKLLPILDDEHAPYFFILTSEHRVQSIFFPHKENTELTRHYFKGIHLRYFF